MSVERSFARRLAVLIVLTTAATFTLTVSAPPASATTRSEERMFRYVNHARENYGRRKVYLSQGLSDIARAHSRKMRSAGRIFHHKDLGYRLRYWSWTRAGENVGRGNGLWAIHKAFMRSSSHRATILYRYYKRVGIGIAWSGDTAYVTEIFTN